MYLYYSPEKSAVWQNRDLLDFSSWRFCWVASSLTQREFRAAVLMLLVHSVRHYLAESLPFQMPWMLLCEHQAIPRQSRMWRHLSCVFHSEINFWYQIFIYKEPFKLFTEFRQNSFLHEASNYLNKCVGPFWKENPLVIGRIMKRDSEVQPDITRDGSRRNGKNHTKSFVYPEKLNRDRVVHLQRGCLLFCGGLWGRWECGRMGMNGCEENLASDHCQNVLRGIVLSTQSWPRCCFLQSVHSWMTSKVMTKEAIASLFLLPGTWAN